jgi:hypothetical protein
MAEAKHAPERIWVGGWIDYPNGTITCHGINKPITGEIEYIRADLAVQKGIEDATGAEP